MLITVDWPGFGESERPKLPYSAQLLARFLADFHRDCCPADCGLIAAGHAAGVALLAHQLFDLRWREMVAVAPTWLGPLPTMANRPAAAFLPIRRLVEGPLIGPLLYRLNTSRPVLELMSRRHVDVAGPGLTPEGLLRRQRISRRRGARFASAAFVTGGLDPFATGDGWLAAAAALPFPLSVVIADAFAPEIPAGDGTARSTRRQAPHPAGPAGSPRGIRGHARRRCSLRSHSGTGPGLQSAIRGHPGEIRPSRETRGRSHEEASHSHDRGDDLG